MAAEEFTVPDFGPQAGWRMKEQDMKNMRLIMMDRREAVLGKILRDLVEREAETVRRRWQATARRIAQEEEARDGR